MNSNPVREIRELEAGLRKVDGKWIFESLLRFSLQQTQYLIRNAAKKFYNPKV